MMILLALMPAVCLADGGSAYDPWRETATYDITYTADVSSLVADDAGVRVWVPVPVDRAYQTVSDIHVEAPWPYQITTDANGNRFVYVEADHRVTDRATIVLRATVERRPMRASADGERIDRSPRESSRFLQSASRIPVSGTIAALAARVVGNRRQPSEKIRSIYEYIVKTMRYDKTGTGWGAGDAAWACRSKYGNCTDFHSLLIGMARSQKIPARFVIGFPLSAERAAGRVKGYHCWAELQSSGSGWFPVDASEAKKSGRRDAYFGVVPSDRVEFTIGRDLVLSPPQHGKPLNFFIYPYAEVNGTATDVPWTLTYERTKAVRDHS